MVVGESQILGQVRLALRTAQDAGAAGRQLGALAQQALRVGKRARTETGIDRAGRSLVTAGLEVAGQVLGPLDGTEVLVVGAGSMSALAATVVAQAGAARVVVANRTLERAERVAAAVGGEAVPLDSLPAALASADLVVSCTGAVGHVLDTDDADRRRRGPAGPAAGRARPGPAARRRPGRPRRARRDRGRPRDAGGRAGHQRARGRRRGDPRDRGRGGRRLPRLAAGRQRRADRGRPARHGRRRGAAPSWSGSTGRLPDLDPHAAGRDRADRRAGSSTSCCTPRPCG